VESIARARKSGKVNVIDETEAAVGGGGDQIRRSTKTKCLISSGRGA